MLAIDRLTVENREKDTVTDNPRPRFAFSLDAGDGSARITERELFCNGWRAADAEQTGTAYGGKPLEPFRTYAVRVRVTDDSGETAERETVFSTGRMGTPFAGRFITDGKYSNRSGRCSPVPMTFRKRISLGRGIASAVLYATAAGIYNVYFDGAKIGDAYFAPGFTSYKKRLQYQTYDVTALLRGAEGEGELSAVVCGGWAAGSYTHKRISGIYAKKQAFLCELRVRYTDGTKTVLGTDASWDVTTDGRYKSADFYDGEVYDAAADPDTFVWHKAACCAGLPGKLIAQEAPSVRAHETFRPRPVGRTETGEVLYDCGQNFAGVIRAVVRAEKDGQNVVFRHAEILQDGELFTKPLRTAKATAVLIAKKGTQIYSPQFTYMGFRYIGVSGISEENIELTAFALYSDLEPTGSFSCSDERIGRLQENVVWGAKSNHMDIPTDCPQRDERMGWAGDTAVFAETACFNFDMRAFYGKWLADLRADQYENGSVPVIVPHIRIPGVAETGRKLPVDFWGDACILVPWALYMSGGDETVLEENYGTMKRYIGACARTARRSRGNPYVWDKMHYGDWCAPDCGYREWKRRGKWTATACLSHSAALCAKIARILGKEEDADGFETLSRGCAEAYAAEFTDGDGILKEEFQTGYVLPLYFSLFSGEAEKNAADRLARLVRENGYRIGTGFTGTPYILFALADHGHSEEAYGLLRSENCPSWLYEVKAGATTVWERWDALSADGSFREENGKDVMVSCNHFANGAAASFLYRRTAGLEPLEPGYRKFAFRPLIPGDGMSYASVEYRSPYGRIVCGWEKEEGALALTLTVPPDAECVYTAPDGETKVFGSGTYRFREKLPGRNGPAAG